MLRVTIELISAISGRTSKLGEMYIANDGERSAQDPKLGDYTVAVQRKSNVDAAPPREIFKAPPIISPKALRVGKVTGYPRLAFNVWRLVTRACLAAFPEERKTKHGLKSCINDEVMRGLRYLADSGVISSHPDIVAAREWLDAATENAAKDAPSSIEAEN